MCGIIGYLGSGDVFAPVIDGLQSLEYRGYDSAGIAYLDKDGPHVLKQVGRVKALQELLDSATQTKATAAIGHTRWATHGTPTTTNAHPHFNTDKSFYVVHNGIIENYQELRKSLQEDGYVFLSETDTEVIPHLIDHYYKKSGDARKAFELAIRELKGAYAIAMCTTHEPDTLYAAKLSSPLIIGVAGKDLLIASDPTAIMDKTKNIVFLDDYEIVTLHNGKYTIKNIQKDVTVDKKIQELDYDVEDASHEGYPNFTLKEIHEAPQTIRMASLGRSSPELKSIKLGGLESVIDQLSHIDRIVIVGCGTAYYASLLGEYYLEELAGIPVEVHLASEFKYRDEPFSRSTAILAVSQSGETADTIAALKKVEKYGVLRLGVVNAVGSTIARMTDAGVYCHAGPERAVASTKAFIAQVMVMLQMALYIGKERSPHYTEIVKEIDLLPGKVEAVLAQAATIEKIAKSYKDYRDFLFIGRRFCYPMALEGALKLKELSLIHAEGYAAGEMKHGPLAMIDENFPTFAFAPQNDMYEKTISNIQEIRARSGPVVAVATEGDKTISKHADDVIFIPKTIEYLEPILCAVAVQLFSYTVAMSKGLDIDRPRNLAKSVTVE